MTTPALEKMTGKPLVQTIGMLTDSQQTAIRNIPSHDNARIPKIEATRPVSMFTGQDFHDLEQRHIFRKRAVPLTLSMMVGEPDTVFAHDGYGIPLLVSRDKQGEVHVFLNACMHKGAKLLEGCDPVKRAESPVPTMRGHMA